MSPRNDTRIDTNCNLSTEIVRDHSDRLVRIETKLDTILDSMDVLFRKAENNATNIFDNSQRLTKIETEKSTAIALITAIGSGLVAVASLLWSVFERAHK